MSGIIYGPSGPWAWRTRVESLSHTSWSCAQTLNTMSKVAPQERKLDLAPSGRGSCKGCQGAFAEGTMRVAKQQTSRFHDGFETLYFHAGCTHGAKSLAMIENLGSVRDTDQLAILRSGSLPHLMC